jgi:ring-1,2-phenylacetyl-CoA epoxidase subunit PaaD
MCSSCLPWTTVVIMPDVIPLVSAEYSERLTRRDGSALGHIWDLLDQVKDPEIPALSIWDLGVLTQIENRDDTIVISITPTYSGCPAMDVIREDVSKALNDAGIENYKIKLVLSPAWNTNMMSPEGRSKLREYGIAPPVDNAACASGQCIKITCPHCGSNNTNKLSEFSSTACKALYQCSDCQEPFDYFKHI